MTTVITRIIPSLGLKYISDSAIATYAQQRIAALTENEASFPGLNPSIVDLQDACNAYSEASSKTGPEGTRSATATKNICRKQLDYLLTQCALSCAYIANSNEAIYLRSGFRIKSSGTRITELEIPKNIKFKQGPFEGSVYVSFKSVQNAGSYEVQVGIDPTASSLTIVNTNKGSKILITDLKPLSIYWGRCRAIGARNIKSPWSHMVRFVVM